MKESIQPGEAANDDGAEADPGEREHIFPGGEEVFRRALERLSFWQSTGRGGLVPGIRTLNQKHGDETSPPRSMVN